MTTGSNAAGELAVCVAINNNDNAWHQMLVPFILSLRRTDYTGHVAVIGFGLSQQKIEILRANAVNVIESAEKSLAVGRYIEVARLCDYNPGLKKVALYDADIWFCHHHFDLFDQIDGNNIFACKDAFFCSFINERLIGPNLGENNRLVCEVAVARMGGAIQAGLVAGTVAAWQDFSRHVTDCMARVGTDFDAGYGFDTTILHLWAAQDRVARLPEVQNYVVKNGVGEGWGASSAPIFFGPGGPIRGLHMTSDVRFTNFWRYYANHRDEALEKGRVFALVTSPVEPVAEIPADLKTALAEAGLEIVALSAEAGAFARSIREGDELHVFAFGNLELELRTTRRIDGFILSTMYYSGVPGPIRTRVFLDDQEVVSGRDASHWLGMSAAEGCRLRLCSESLAGQMCKVIWTFRGDLFLWQ